MKSKLVSTFFLSLSLTTICVRAQSEKLDIETCYRLARENYPAIQKLELLSRTGVLDIENIGKDYLPQFSISGQASYQSQTMSFADALGALPAGIALPSISKDQYKIQGELSQLIYDGGASHAQKEISKASTELQKQNVETSLYGIRQRINTLFFSILLLDAQIRQNELNKTSLNTQADKTQALLNNGSSFRSNLDELKAEVLNIDMTATEYRSNRQAYLDMLSLFIGRKLLPSTDLQSPVVPESQMQINRPELKSFELQNTLYNTQERQLRSAYLPKFNAFFQGAYGRPTLNIIENKFGPWYITGIRLNWSLGSLYTLGNKKKTFEFNRKSVEADKETFLLNTRVDMSQQEVQVSKFTKLLAQDEQSIVLRSSVTRAALAQLDNGVITTHEYIQKVNAEHLARQMMVLHQIQLLQARYQQKFISGN